jgi:hypothetical protein
MELPAIDQLGRVLDVDRGEDGVDSAAMGGARGHGIAVIDGQGPGVAVETDGAAGPAIELDLDGAVALDTDDSRRGAVGDRGGAVGLAEDDAVTGRQLAALDAGDLDAAEPARVVLEGAGAGGAGAAGDGREALDGDAVAVGRDGDDPR